MKRTRKSPRYFAVLLAIQALPATVAAAEAKPRAEALPDSAELYAKIRAKYQPMYENYRGIETKSRAETKIYDSETNELKETMTMIYVGREYFYEEREGEVLEYFKNGEKLDPSEARQGGGSDPMYNIWDADGPKHYRVKVLKKTMVHRRPCYALQIIPKDDTDRHFIGTVFVHTETLELVYMDGSMADLPFGVDAMSFKFYLKQQGVLSVVDHGTTSALVDIPIIFPDTLYTTEMHTIEAKGIPK